MSAKTIVHGVPIYVASLADNKECESLNGVGDEEIRDRKGAKQINVTLQLLCVA